MRKLISVLAVLLLSLPALAGSGYHAGFTGVQDICRSNLRTRPSTVAEYCFGAADGSGNVPDFSGGNLLTDRTEFDDWVESGTCTVTADVYRNPVDGAVDADYLDNTGDVNGYRTRVVTVGGVVGDTFTFSVRLRSDYVHSARVWVWESGVAELSSKTITVTKHYRRFSTTGTFAGGGSGSLSVAITPGDQGTSVGQIYAYGAHLQKNDEFRIGMGPFINPTDQSITKPPLDLAPMNDPTPAKASFQGVDGNRIEAREGDGVDQAYNVAHHDSMNINDTDHTYTIAACLDIGAVGFNMIFSHGSANVDGVYVYGQAADDQWVARYNGGSGVADAIYSAAPDDGRCHIIQLVRSGNTATLYVDENTDGGVDVTGKGLDAARTFYLMRNIGGNYWDGRLIYFRLDAEALSAEELAYDREVLSGLASNQPTNALSVTRATTAYTEFDGGTMAEIAVNQPRIGGPGGGLLIEGQGQNLVLQSQDFSTTWTTTQATVSTDVAVAPDGKTTVDGLVATAVATQHGVAQNEIDLTADSYVLHVWAEPGDQDWLYLDVSTVANATAYFNIATGFVGTTGAGIDDSGIESAWGNFYHAWIVFTGTVAQHTFCVYSAEADNDNQFLGDASTVNTYVWQAQVEKGTFPTTIVPTTTVPVTRNADSVTLDPHPSGKPEARALPETFAPNTVADKLTIYGGWKAEWSSATDIGVIRRLVGIGDAASADNNVEIYVNPNGRVYLSIRDNGSTVRTIFSGVHTFYSDWYSVRAVVDFTDLSRSELYVNGAVDHTGDTNMTGSATFDTTGCLLRLGANRVGTVDGFHWTRELRINNQEIRP